MKIYISGKVTGTNDYVERFAEAQRTLEVKYPCCEVVNPVRENSKLPEDTSWIGYMANSVNLLSECDVIYMLKGWEQSRGAGIEHTIAIGAEMEVIYE